MEYLCTTFKHLFLLTLNVPGDCGSSRPTREWNRGCIAWALNGKCGGGAWAVRPTHLSTQLRPAHSVRPAQLNRGPRISRRSAHLPSPALITQSAHFAWAHALCVGPRTLRGPALFAWARALCNPRAWRPTHWYPFPCNCQPIQFPIQANHALYYLKPIPCLTQGRNQNRLHNLLIMPQIRQSSNRTDGFLTSWHSKTLRNIEICT